MWQLYQRGVGGAPLTRRQVRKPVGSDGHTHQPQDWITHGCGHAPYLTVAPLDDDEFDPGGRDVFANAYRRISWPQFRFWNEMNFRRKRTTVIELHALAQSFQRHCVRFPFDLNPVSLG